MLPRDLGVCFPHQGLAALPSPHQHAGVNAGRSPGQRRLSSQQAARSAVWGGGGRDLAGLHCPPPRPRTLQCHLWVGVLAIPLCPPSPPCEGLSRNSIITCWAGGQEGRGGQRENNSGPLPASFHPRPPSCLKETSVSRLQPWGRGRKEVGCCPPSSVRGRYNRGGWHPPDLEAASIPGLSVSVWVPWAFPAKSLLLPPYSGVSPLHPNYSATFLGSTSPLGGPHPMLPHRDPPSPPLVPSLGRLGHASPAI